MPVTVAQIAANTATVTFRYGEDPITLLYHPGRVTENTFATMQAFAAMDPTHLMDTFHDMNALLCHILKSWDVFEDEAQTLMFPLDAARLSELPIMFRIQCLVAIMGDIRPEAVTGQVVGALA